MAAADMPDLLTLYASSQPKDQLRKPGSCGKPAPGVVTWIYAQLEAEANRLANVLASLGVGPGEKVIWCGPNSLPRTGSGKLLKRELRAPYWACHARQVS